MKKCRHNPFITKGRAIWVALLFLFPLGLLAQPKAGIRVGGWGVVKKGQTISICVGTGVFYFNEASGGTSIRWRFNNGSPNSFNGFSPTSAIVYNKGGIDTTWQVVSDGTKSDTTFILVKVNDEKPKVAFTHSPDGECGSRPIEFKNSTTGGGGLKYVWNFGDGRGTVTLPNPSRVFETKPDGDLIQKFQVKLIATNDGNCTDSVTREVKIKRTPDPSIDRGDPNFEFLQDFNGVPTFRKCENTPSYHFAFKNATQTASQNIKYTVNWGDGSADSVFTTWPIAPGSLISHTYLRGNTSMVVKVAAADGCEGSRTYNVFLGTTPAGGFASRGNTSICAPNALTFAINESEKNAPGTRYTVTVNDSSAPQVFRHPAPAEVTHVFEKTSCGENSSNGANIFQNAYRAVLDIENPCGTTSVSVIPIYVSGKPKAKYIINTDSSICVNTTVEFTDTSVYGGTITPSGGNSATCNSTGKLVWAISPSTGVTVTNGQLGSLNGRPEDGFFWTSGSKKISAKFTQTGKYLVTIYAANDLCGVDSFTREICVRIPPEASFAPDKKTGCAPFSVTFKNHSPQGDCKGDRYYWSIGFQDPLKCGTTADATFIDGTNATSKEPKISFANPGKYLVDFYVIANASGCRIALEHDTIFAVAKPQVDVDPITGLCEGNLLHPAATVNNCYGMGTPTYLWTFTGGTPSSAAVLSPGSIAYGVNGTYPVKFAATNDCGTTTVVQSLLVGPRPVANAGHDKEVCSGLPVTIGSSEVPGVQYQWQPASGLDNTASANPTLTFHYSGNANDTTVQYVVRAFTAADCFNTDTVLVKVKRSPLVLVNPNSTSVCNGASVLLTASGADNYSWSPATGLNVAKGDSVIAQPSITTTYTVIGSLANGCEHSAQVTVLVISRPQVNAGPDTLACNNAPNIILSGEPANGKWTGPRVSSSGVFNPRAAGNGQYKLIYEFLANGCDGKDSLLVTVQDPPASNAGRDTSICADGSTYRLLGRPAGGTWGGSVLVTPSGDFTASAAGIYQLVYSRGSGSCIGYDTVQVTVVSGVSNNTISATQGVCLGVTPQPLIGSNASAGGLALQYQWQSSPDSINWSDMAGQTGKDLVVPSPLQTIYYRRLANTSVCMAGAPSNVVRVYIHPNALAEISPAPLVACSPFAINASVINLSHYPERNSIYRWFANGNLIGTGEVFPGHTIVAPDDSVTIRLVAISRFGCVNDTAAFRFKTISNPDPSFTLSDTVGCGPLNILVSNTTPKAERYGFIWDFGTGQTFTGEQPGTVFFPVNPNRGDTVYTVSLKATGGCDTFRVERKIRVRSSPRTLFTPNKAEGCSPFLVTFNNNSAGSNATFRWDFGDGSPSVPAGLNSVTHTYYTGRLDTFRVRLFGANDCGTDTGRFNLVVNPNRVRLDFAVNGDELNGCAPHAVTFINNTLGANLFRWDFGDGSPLLTTNKGFDTLRHTYTDTGKYVVTLFASNGCSDTTTTEQINVSERPVVAFTLTPATICLGHAFSLENKSEQGLAFNWSFGDGATSTQRNPIKNYSAAGTYTIVLRGTRQFAQGFSCTDSALSTLQVIAPTGDWRYRGGYYCAGQPAFFEVTNSNATRYRFYFGNGDSVITTSPSVSYTYPQPGAFLPRVTLEYQGCLLTLPGTDTIRMDKTSPGFTIGMQQSCGATRVEYGDTSSAFFGIAKWLWQFGDGTSSTQKNPARVFGQSGNYPVTLRITSRSGCTDTVGMVLRVEVEQPPVVGIDGDTVACSGQAASFVAFDASNTAIVFDWSMVGGPGQSGRRISNTWLQTGLFQVRMIGRTLFGCADTAYRFIRVNPTPIVKAGNDVTICRGQSTQLTATGSSVLAWSPIQGLSCSNCSSPQAGPNFTTHYFVTGTNSFGCSHTDSVLVNVAQPFNITVSANDTICASRNESAQLFASGAYRYQWNPLLGLNSSNIPNPVARPASTTTYRVIGFDAENCFTDTAYVTVGVGYNPTVDVPRGTQVVAGTQVLLNAQYTGGPFSRYTWTPAGDLSCGNCPTPIATVNVNTRYTVVAETIYGCSATDTTTYTVICQKDQVFIPNAFSPDGDGVNDILMVRGKGVAMVKSFRIFNRFGQVVFERQNFSANDPTAGWNGKINGVAASADVYVYTAEVQCTWGGVYFTYKGNVTLFR